MQMPAHCRCSIHWHTPQGHCYQQEQLALLDAAIRCHRRALPYDKEGVAVHELVSEA